VPPTGLPPAGTEVRLRFLTSKLHCFHPELGHRLGPTA
jgi:hypothetical protein